MVINMSEESNDKKEFPYEIVTTDSKLTDEVLTFITGENPKGFLQTGPKRYFSTYGYKEEAANIYNMPLRSSDIFVVTFPRSGTTWTQELVWLINNNLNYEKGLEAPLTSRYVFLEFSTYIHTEMKNRLSKEDDAMKLVIESMSEPGTRILARTPSPRFIKSHLPLSLLPTSLLDTKVVYVARDPRDVAVSYYHHLRLMKLHQYVGDFKSFWDLFRRDLVNCAPYFEHVNEAWNLRNHENLLFLFYEDMNKDLPTAVRRVSDFFGKKYTETQLQGLCEHLKIENFKKNSSVNLSKNRAFMNEGEQGFIRKGKSGGWRDYFDDEMTKEAEEWIKDKLKNTDLKFPFSI